MALLHVRSKVCIAPFYVRLLSDMFTNVMKEGVSLSLFVEQIYTGMFYLNCFFKVYIFANKRKVYGNYRLNPIKNLK